MSNTGHKDIKVAQDPQKPIEREVLAAQIIEISRAVQKLQSSGLNRRAIVVLVAHSAKLGHGIVSDVLNALDQLETDYVRR